MEIVIGSANIDYSLDYILEMGTLWTEHAGPIVSTARKLDIPLQSMTIPEIA